MLRALLVVLIACNGGEKDPSGLDTDSTTADDTDPVAVDDTDDGPATLPFEAFCARAAQAYVDHLARCFPEVYDPEGPFVGVNEENCLAAREAIDEGRLSYDPASAAACVVAAEAETGCTWDLQGFRSPACDDAFTALVPLGGACGNGDGRWAIIDDTCAEGWCNDRSSCPGSCEAFVGVGADCTTAQCEWTTSICDPTSLRCVALPVSGEACPAGACATGARCEDGTCRDVADPAEGCDADHLCALPAMACVDDVCTLHFPEGMTCEFDFQCSDPLACRDGDGDGATECLPRGGLDTPCDAHNDCTVDLYCDSWPDTCQPRPQVDEDCHSDAPCVEGAWCRYRPEQPGICSLTGDRGDDCAVDGYPADDPLACAEGLLCMQDTTCQPPGAAGDPCNATTPSCADDLVCDRATWTCIDRPGLDAPCNPLPAGGCADGLTCQCTGTPEECQSWLDINPQAWHTCKPTLDEGDACWANDECASRFCDFCGTGECDFGSPGVCGPAFDQCVP